MHGYTGTRVRAAPVTAHVQLQLALAIGNVNRQACGSRAAIPARLPAIAIVHAIGCGRTS